MLLEYLFLCGESKQAEGYEEEAEYSDAHVSQSEINGALFSCITSFFGMHG
jgi:hypothetical protein